MEYKGHVYMHSALKLLVPQERQVLNALMGLAVVFILRIILIPNIHWWLLITLQSRETERAGISFQNILRYPHSSSSKLVWWLGNGKYYVSRKGISPNNFMKELCYPLFNFQRKHFTSKGKWTFHLNLNWKMLKIT